MSLFFLCFNFWLPDNLIICFLIVWICHTNPLYNTASCSCPFCLPLNLTTKTMKQSLLQSEIETITRRSHPHSYSYTSMAKHVSVFCFYYICLKGGISLSWKISFESIEKSSFCMQIIFEYICRDGTIKTMIYEY